MGNGIGIYRSPLDIGGYYQFVAPYQYSFYKNGKVLGRILWLKLDEIDGIYTDKDLEN